MAIKILYCLSEIGKRDYLKTFGCLPQNPVVLTIEPRHEWYEDLCNIVDLDTLTIDCSKPMGGSLRVSSSGDPFLMELVLNGVYLETDFYIDPSYTDWKLMEALLSALSTLKKVNDVRQKRLADLSKSSGGYNIVCHDHHSYLMQDSFERLREQVDHGLYIPGFLALVLWDSASIFALLRDLKWPKEYYDNPAQGLPWDRLQFYYGASRLAPKKLPMDFYSVSDVCGQRRISKEKTEVKTFNSCGKDLKDVVLIPKLESFLALERSLEAQDQKRADFLRSEASPYCQRLAASKKNYGYVLDREILTKKYSGEGVYLRKHIDKHEYKSRSCPSAVEYLFMEEILKKYPDLSEPRFYWLEVRDDQTVSWANSVLVCEAPYHFDLVFVDKSAEEFPAEDSQKAYTEDELWLSTLSSNNSEKNENSEKVPLAPAPRSLSQHIYRSSCKLYEKTNQTINLSKLGSLLGTRTATIWSYHHGKTKWPADDWLLSMILIGAARVNGKMLTIEIPDEILDPAYPIVFSPETLRKKTKAVKSTETSKKNSKSKQKLVEMFLKGF